MLEDSIGPSSSGGEGSVSYTVALFTRLLFALHLIQNTLHKGIADLRTAASLFSVIFIRSLYFTSQGQRSAFSSQRIISRAKEGSVL
jgi:hypothetical protein